MCFSQKLLPKTHQNFFPYPEISFNHSETKKLKNLQVQKTERKVGKFVFQKFKIQFYEFLLQMNLQHAPTVLEGETEWAHLPSWSARSDWGSRGPQTSWPRQEPTANTSVVPIAARRTRSCGVSIPGRSLTKFRTVNLITDEMIINAPLLISLHIFIIKELQYKKHVRG